MVAAFVGVCGWSVPSRNPRASPRCASPGPIYRHGLCWRVLHGSAVPVAVTVVARWFPATRAGMTFSGVATVAARQPGRRDDGCGVRGRMRLVRALPEPRASPRCASPGPIYRHGLCWRVLHGSAFRLRSRLWRDGSRQHVPG